LLPTTYYLLPTTYYLLPTTYYLLPTTYYLLPTTYYALSGKITAPLMVDKKTRKIVSQESKDIVRIIAQLSSLPGGSEGAGGAGGAGITVESEASEGESDPLSTSTSAYLYPSGLGSIDFNSVGVEEVEALNEWMYERLNNGTYCVRCTVGGCVVYGVRYDGGTMYGVRRVGGVRCSLHGLLVYGCTAYDMSVPCTGYGMYTYTHAN
ncbi:hypothetical protein B484DRAFT_467157, partial [Ochromonadaceae sp. CCMP2298]